MMRDQLIETLYKAMSEALANVHTATIARVTSVGATTINCQPIIARVVEGVPVQLPEFINVPPVFLNGGGSYTAYPIQPGDYALLIFTERCFDNWYNGVDGSPPADFRMHDYSDGFALVGIVPAAGAIPIPVDVVKRVGDSEVEGDYQHTGNYSIDGNLTVNGDGGGGVINLTNTTINLIGGDIIADGISLKEHIHSGVQPGSGNTAEPVG
jgi:hypothetical protein